MAKKIDFPQEIEDLRVKFKVNKTNMQKFLVSCGELDTVEDYVAKIEEEYGHDHISSESVEKKFVGFHPISGEKIYR